jgi:hypothetical protein
MYNVMHIHCSYSSALQGSLEVKDLIVRQLATIVYGWNTLHPKLYMNPTKNLIELKLYMNPTKNLIELKFYMNPTKNLIDPKLYRSIQLEPYLDVSFVCVALEFMLQNSYSQ